MTIFPPKGRNKNHFRNHEKLYCSLKNKHFYPGGDFIIFNMQKLFCVHKLKHVLLSATYDENNYGIKFAFYIIITTLNYVRNFLDCSSM